MIIIIASLDPASSKIPDDTADGCHIGRCLVSVYKIYSAVQASVYRSYDCKHAGNIRKGPDSSVFACMF